MNNYNHAAQELRSFFTHVFLWMAIGLGITAGTSWYVFQQSPVILIKLMESPLLVITLFFVQIGLVFWLASRLLTMSFMGGLTLFLLYALLNGIIFSTIFAQFTHESIALTFLIAAAMFLAMALFGSLTTFDLTPIGTFGYMLLWGLIIGLLVNWYFQSEVFNLAISAIGIILFSALTAYDMQRLAFFGAQLQRQHQEMYKGALLGALMLYIDFINIFLMLLSFTGKRRE